MSANEFTAAPHLRSVRIVHTCEIASLSGKQNNEACTARYFELRDEIEDYLLALPSDVIGL